MRICFPLEFTNMQSSVLVIGSSPRIHSSCIISHAHRHRTTTITTTHHQVPLSRANLQDVSHLVETLKAIEYCFARKDQAVAEAHVLIVRGYCETIYGITYQVRVCSVCGGLRCVAFDLVWHAVVTDGA